MPATLADKLLIPPYIFLALGKTLTAAATGAFRGQSGAPTYGTHVFNAGLRAFLDGFSAQQIQWLLPPFAESYKSWCTKNKITPDMCKVPTSASPGSVNGFWIGEKTKAKYHMIHYHGGGWAMPGGGGHLDLLNRFVRWSNGRLAVFCISYSLSPEAQYPTALSQCVDGLRYLLQQPDVSPSKVLLSGDSAGGNLAIGVISHLIHPHPNTKLMKPIDLKEPLFGAIVLDAWISADTKRYQSFTQNQYRDTFPTSTSQYWGKNYTGPNPPASEEEYIWPAHADASWWKGTPVQNTIATVGEHEILFGPVTDWAEKYRVGAGREKLELVVGEKEAHIEAIVAPRKQEELEDPKCHGQERAIMLWIREKLV